jgi:hypothetical protein
MVSPNLRLPIWLAASALALSGCGGGGGDSASAGTSVLASRTSVGASESLQVYATKVSDCANGDQPETALQGQVPAALRTGFKGFNCNLELAGQYRGEGGNWSSATFRGAGRSCAFHSTGSPTIGGVSTGRKTPGVPVIDITDPANPTRVESLTSTAMLDPWESLRVNQRRKLLYADYGTNSGGGPDFDVYDLSGDCTTPQLMSTVKLSYLTNGPGSATAPVNGHEGTISPDGLTYYIGDITNGKYHAVDVSNPARPKVIATWDIRKDSPIGNIPHGLSISKDGNRAYVVAIAFPTPQQVADPSYAKNGFIVLDTSEVQARKPDAQMKLVSATAFRDGTVAQHTIITKIRGKPHLVMVDEGGSAGLADAANAKLACSQGLAPFPMARIYDMSDEKHPQLVSKLGLETHDPNNCDAVLPDIAGLSIFTYGSHYCSVDNLENSTALACSYFNSGVRVFDIREPAHPKEIAYYNPAGQTTPVPGSNHVMFRQWRAGGPDWCASRLDFDKANGTLTTMCQDNGLMVMKFKKGVWPFDNSQVAQEDED